MTAIAPLSQPALAGTDAAPPAPRRGRRWTAYLLLAPGALWLLVLYAVPLVQLFATSLYDPAGSLARGYVMAWELGNYAAALSAYGPHFARSLLYAGIATVLAFALGYPLAYAMAFKAGRWKSLMMLLVVAPFFTSFLVRTLAWKSILADNGPVVDVLQWVGLLGADGRLLATPIAVVTGLTYNFLPFMILPLYASLEKIDPRLVEAASDLYASPARAFAKVTLPLSVPGVIGGTLMTFIPAAGDYINAELLGTPTEYMIGNVINSQFLVTLNYPQAAALSFLLMAMILALVFLYVRRAGTKELV